MALFPGTLSQRAFTGGELSPSAWSRIDIENYLHGLKTARNGFVQRQGGFTNRPGTAKLALTGNGANPVRLIPFVFSNNVSYALEFGNQYMRVFRAGVQINVAGVAAWNGGTDYKVGNLVVSGGVNYYCVLAHTNHVPPNATYWFALTGSIYSIPTPYTTADLPNIQIVQAENVLYIACAGFQVQKLTCTADTNWVFSQLTYAPTAPQPAGNLGMSYQNTDNFFLNGNNKIQGTFMVFGTLGMAANTGGGDVWNYPWHSSNVNDQLVPGVNSFPNNTAFRNAYYCVTSVDLDTGIESLPMLGSFSNFKCVAVQALPNGPVSDPFIASLESRNQNNNSVITAVALTNPLKITVTSNSIAGVQTFNTGDLFNIVGTGIPQLDGNTFTGTVTGNVITFIGIDATLFPAAVLTGASVMTSTTSVITAVPPAATQSYDATYIGGITLGDSFEMAHAWNQSPLGLSWAAPAGGGNFSYNVYKKALNGLWGFMANVTSTGYIDDGTNSPDTSKGIPTYKNNFIGISGFPSVIGVYQQRLMLANTPSQPDQVWASNVGNFQQFSSSTPTPRDSDTVSFKVSGQQYNAVNQMVDNGFMLLFTETGEFSCYGSGASSSAGALTPTGIGLVQQAFYGGSKLLRPLSIGKNVLYLQSLQSKVRELLYNYYINGYSGNDLTIFSNHLFDNHTFPSWAYQQEPNSLVWIVRDDGMLLSLTYIPELQMKAWTRHDTLGKFEQIVSIPEGSEHALYCVVNRFNGTRFVERFASRQIPLIPVLRFIPDGENAGQVITEMVPDWTKFVFMDCSSFYDGRNTSATTMTMGASVSYAPDGPGIPIQASVPTFNGGMVGNTAVIFQDPLTGTTYKCAIVAYTNSQNVLARPNNAIPVDLQQVAVTNWALGLNTLSGLDYLNGQAVSILGDGAVVSSPENISAMQTVVGGTIALDSYYSFIRVGLPYYTDMRALDIDTPQQGQTSQDKPQRVNKVALFVNQTRGIWAGSVPPTDDALDPKELLTSFPIRNYESMGNNPQDRTGIMECQIDAQWMYGGGIFIRQLAPLPMTVLSIVPAGKFMMGG